MTKPTIALTELVEKGADADLLKQMIQFVAQRMICLLYTSDAADE